MRATSFLLVATLLFAASAEAEDSLEAVIAALHRTEAAFDSVGCSYLLIGKTTVNPEMVLNRRASATWSMMAAGTGKLEYEQEREMRGEQTRFDKEVMILRDFGGHGLTRYWFGEEGTITTTELPIYKRFATRLLTPLQMTIDYGAFAASLHVKAFGHTVGSDEWENRQVVVVDVTASDRKDKERRLLWIDVERGSVVRRLRYVVEEATQSLKESLDGTEFKEVQEGVWCPNKFTRSTYNNGNLFIRDDYVITNWEINCEVDLSIRVPAGAK